MFSKQKEKYFLYQTLSNGNINEDKVDDKKLLSKIISFDKNQNEAMFMLICEHARLKDDFSFSKGENIFPYLIKYNNNNKIKFNLLNLPEELKNIIWKFSNISNFENIV